MATAALSTPRTAGGKTTPRSRREPASPQTFGLREFRSPAPRHPSISAAEGRPSSKQANQVPILAHLTGVPQPDLSAMTYGEARLWIAERWHTWMAR